jgi:hypothetical protein
MWEPQPLATLRASTACTRITLPLPLPPTEVVTPYVYPSKLNQVRLRALNTTYDKGVRVSVEGETVCRHDTSVQNVCRLYTGTTLL